MPRGVPAIFSTYSITLRGSTVWRACREISGAGSSRRRITGTGRTQREAVARMEANYGRYLGEVAAGITRRPQLTTQRRTGPTVADYVPDWFTTLNPQRVSETVRRKYLRALELHVLPHVGSRPLTALTREDLDKLFMVTLPGKKRPNGQPALSPAGRASIYKVLNLLLVRALRDHKIAENPLTGVERPHHERRHEDVAQRAHQAIGLLRHIDESEHRGRFLLQFLGLRRSERLGLTWDRVRSLNTSNARIDIHQQLARDEHGAGYYIKAATKTEAGRRTIPLVEPFLTAIREEKKKQDRWRKLESWNPTPGLENLVFTTPTGSHYTHNKDNDDWHALLAKHGYPYWRAHLNRHITASLLAAMDVPVSVAKNILGHSSDAMNAYYSHAIPSEMTVHLAKYGERISKGKR